MRLSKVWSLLPETANHVAAVIRANIHVDLDAPAKVAVGPQPARTSAGVAVIPVRGVITHRGNIFTELLGGTSVDGLRRALRQVMLDKSVGSVVLDIDSPGGEVSGIPELAEEIRALRDVKPIVALANPLAASGAYWLASSASEVMVIPSGEVGSVGVFAMHVDMSAAMEAMGVKPTFIHAGKFKVEGNPYEALTPEAKEYMQAQVDEFYGMFVDAVARGRGTSASNVKANYGEGRTVLAKDALQAGMVDQVGSLEDAIAQASLTASRARRSADLDWRERRLGLYAK